MRKTIILFTFITIMASCKDEKAKRTERCIDSYSSEIGKEKAKAFCDCYQSKLAAKYDVKVWDTVHTSETFQWLEDCRKQYFK